MSSQDERGLSDMDQTASDGDQSAADVDQTLSDSDRSSSERDQRASDQDQRAAEIDQAASDEVQTQASDALRRRQAREMRAESKDERDFSSHARGHTTVSRDKVAAQRDEIAQARDRVSAARDALAETLDGEIERLELESLPGAQGGFDKKQLEIRVTQERLSAARSRARAATHREAAAEDRAHAARDRELAALDRAAYATELAAAEVDEVTGALRRRVGLAALRREIDRTRRSGEPLTVVFIDVDGLKQVNDERGHTAGDELLKAVVDCVSEEFRSYDLMIRVGGDEFVCSLTGDGLEGIGSRFERVRTRLSNVIPGASLSTGVSQCRAEDSVETVVERADRAMITTRRKRTRPRSRHH